MKDMPARVPARFLLAVSLLLAGTYAPPKAQSRAAAPGTAQTLHAARPLTVMTPPTSHAVAPQTELETLSRNGPAIPAVFTMNELRFRALFKWDWALHFVYELAQPGAVTLTVSVDGHDHPVVFNVRGLVRGIHMLSANLNHACKIPLPGGIGTATYSIKAVTARPPADGVVPFFVRAIAAGPRGERGAALWRGDAVASTSGDFSWLRGARLTDAAYGFAPASYQVAVPLGISRLIFTPRDIRVVGGRPNANAAYSFSVTLPFNGGAEAQVLLLDGGSSARVSRQAFNRRLEAGETINGTWDCMRDGSPSLGRHRLYVKAWYTIQAGGKWSFLSSDPVVVRH